MEREVGYKEPIRSLNQGFFEELFLKSLPNAGDLSPTNDQIQMARQIETRMGQKLLDNFIHLDGVRKSKVGRATLKAREMVHQSFVIRPDNSKVEHQFHFHFKAVQKELNVQYTGLFTSELTYKHEFKDLVLSMSRELFSNMSVAVTNDFFLESSTVATTLFVTYNF